MESAARPDLGCRTLIEARRLCTPCKAVHSLISTPSLAEARHWMTLDRIFVDRYRGLRLDSCSTIELIVWSLTAADAVAGQCVWIQF